MDDEQSGEKKVVRAEVNAGNVDTSVCEDGKYYRLIRETDPDTGNSSEHVEVIDETTWYKKVVEQKYPPLEVLVPHPPFVRRGVSVPRFYVEWKWRPVYDQLRKASEAFPQLVFHLHYFIEQDGPTGECVFREGQLLEQTERMASWYLFDDLQYPSVSLLPAHMGLSLAQHEASRVQDAIETVEQVRAILDDPRFIDSPFHECRSGRKLSEAKRTLDALLASLRQASLELSFDGVLLEEAEAAEAWVKEWAKRGDGRF